MMEAPYFSFLSHPLFYIAIGVVVVVVGILIAGKLWHDDGEKL